MLRSQRGQATVELVALIPLLVLLAAGVWQAAVLGHVAWSAGAAARAGSRAAAVGGDARAAALRVVPAAARAAARVREARDGAVSVTVPVRAVAGGATLARVTSTARFEPQR
jgi:Flp pilus assembly protein TadG